MPRQTKSTALVFSSVVKLNFLLVKTSISFCINFVFIKCDDENQFYYYMADDSRDGNTQSVGGYNMIITNNETWSDEYKFKYR